MAESAAYSRRGLPGGARATTLSGDLNSSATTIPGADLSTWAGATTNGPICWTLDRGLATEESGEATGVSGNNLTGCTRGLFGTSAQAHSSGATLELTSSKRDYDEANKAVAETIGTVTAAGDTIYADAANGFARLAKGTARQAYLMNAGATAPEWAASMQSLLTAQGDIIYASAANTPARLAKGTASQVLTMNAGATAPEWAAAAAAAAALTGAKVYKTMTETIVSGTGEALLFDAEEFDSDGFHSTVTNTNRLTVPTGKGGLYLIAGTAEWDGNATGYREIAFFNQGGSALRGGRGVVFPTSTATVYHGHSVVVELAAADWVEMFVTQNSGADRTIGTAQTSFSMVRIAV